MPHHYHFRMPVDTDTIDDRVDELGFQTRSEYIRYLIRRDLEER